MTTKIKIGIGHVELTDEELSEMYYDQLFMLDAITVLMNPKLAEESWDIPYDEKEVKDRCCKLLLRNGFSEDFVNKLKEPK
jgi:hypothetical protein